jgi:hypothetical protein
MHAGRTNLQTDVTKLTVTIRAEMMLQAGKVILKTKGKNVRN